MTTNNPDRGFFHGMVLRAGKWIRLLTGAPLLSEDKVVEEFQSGQYRPAFLEHFFPGTFRVEVRKINRRKKDGNWSFDALTNQELQSSEVIRWSNASDQVSVRIKGAQGWLLAFNEIGLIVRNSKKMSKRLTEIIRMSCMWMYRDADNQLKVQVIDHKALGYPDCYVDGATAITRSVAIQCVRSNTTASREWRARQIWMIHRGITTVVQIRLLCDKGLLKGNALILPKSMMGGYDIRTFEPNIKGELSTTGWQWLTIEPTYGAIPVKSDDQTHAIYHTISGLYDRDSLMEPFKMSLEQAFEDLKNGKRAEWMEKLADHESAILHDDAEERFAPTIGMVAQIQQTVAALTQLGVPLTASQTLMYMTINGMSKMILGDPKVFSNVHKMPMYGNVWMDKNRHWFPVQWAYAAHIYTKEVLEIFGYKMPKGNHGFYHGETHSFVVPGKFFEKNLANLGGPDLDDTVKVHIRRVRHKNGRITTNAIILRNPNDFGEWCMIPVKEYGPVFHDYGVNPPVVDLEVLTQSVPQFTKLKRQLTIGQLPAIQNPPVLGEVFSLEDEARVRLMSKAFPAGVGGTVIPKMIWNATVSGVLDFLPATNEDIIDVLQQGQGSEEDAQAISEWIETVFAKMEQENGGELDKFWFFSRLPAQLREQFTASAQSSWVTLHQEREFAFRDKFKEMQDWLNSNVAMPQVLADIQWTPEEIVNSTAELVKIDGAYRQFKQEWAAQFVQLLEKSDVENGEEYTNRKILRLAHRAILHKQVAPGKNWDQWLYSFDPKLEKLPVHWFIRALKAQRNQ